MLSDQNLSHFFLSYLNFWHYYRNSYQLKTVSNDFKIHWNTLYLKDYKWLLSQNQQVRTFLVLDGTRLWLNISNLFLKNKNKSNNNKKKMKGRQCPDYMLFKSISAKSITCPISVLRLFYVSIYNTVSIPILLTWSKLP